MKILVLNGSPRTNGNTARMVKTFSEGAKAAGNQVDVVNVCRRKIAGCLACEYCHTKGNGECIQKDGMQEIYELLKEANMLVLASPIYNFGFSGQLQCVLNRTYAIGTSENLPNLKKAAMVLSSGDPDVYEGVVYGYKRGFMEFLKLKDMGIFTSSGEEDDHTDEELLQKLHAFGESLTESEEMRSA